LYVSNNSSAPCNPGSPTDSCLVFTGALPGVVSAVALAPESALHRDRTDVAHLEVVVGNDVPGFAGVGGFEEAARGPEVERGGLARHPHTRRSRPAPATRRDPAPDVSPRTGHRLKSTPAVSCGPVTAGSPASSSVMRQGGPLGRKIMPRRLGLRTALALSAYTPGFSARFQFQGTRR